MGLFDKLKEKNEERQPPIIQGARPTRISEEWAPQDTTLPEGTKVVGKYGGKTFYSSGPGTQENQAPPAPQQDEPEPPRQEMRPVQEPPQERMPPQKQEIPEQEQPPVEQAPAPSARDEELREAFLSGYAQGNRDTAKKIMEALLP